jgi:DNA-binding LacI/PurR family transcriptional regulator
VAGDDGERDTVAASARAARPAVIGDVARLAGVSNQTVSRVLNDRPRVHPETRERVLEAVRQLSYRPNAMARGLVRRRSHMLGVVSFDTVLFGPAATLRGIGRAARAAGYGVNIVTPDSVDRAGVVDAVETLASQAVAGVIIVFAPQAAATTALYNLPSSLPVVAIEAGVDDQIPVVRVDQVAGARLAVEHLLELGHHTVWPAATTSPPSSPPTTRWRSACSGPCTRVAARCRTTSAWSASTTSPRPASSSRR